MKVAIIDTGVNLKNVKKYNFVQYEDEYDYDSHGTQMAKIIREVAGYDVEIISLKVCDRAGSSVNGVICSALVKCMEILDEGDIINISLGINYESILVKNMIKMLVAKGIRVCCASGNYKHCYPSKYRDGLISVGACDENGNLCDYTIEGSYDVLELGEWNYVDKYGREKNMKGTSISCARYVGRLCRDEM